MDKTELFVGVQRSEHTQRAYKGDLTYWFGWLGGRQPTDGLALAFREHLLTTMAQNSAMRRFHTIKAYYKWAFPDANPFAKVKGPQRITGWLPKAPTDDDVESLWGTIGSTRDKAVVGLLMNGLRAAEVASLSRADLTFEPEYDRWVVRVIGKGRKLRLVPLTSEAADAIVRYTGYPDILDAEPLIRSTKGERMTMRQVEYVVDKWSKVAGVDLHPHALRHHYATRLARAGVGLPPLQRLLGHSRADTTQQYLSLVLSDIIEAVNNDPREQKYVR